MSEQEVLVSINVPPILEEEFVDCLLAVDEIESFNSRLVNSHSRHAHEEMSIAEQVAGRKKLVNFQVYILEGHIFTLISQLKRYFSESGIQYWVLSVLSKGNL
ncbi:MAG: DUF3240 family protein [Methyloprofundus sp.]|nr:DUF3240 family protein [Methyloprofundus sp.]